MGTKTKARGMAAFRITGMNRDRFNEAVAAGIYSCAPPTRQGASRVFEMHDLIALYLFARMTEGGRSAHEAARIACLISDHLRVEPEASMVTIVEPVMGSAWTTSDMVNPVELWSGGSAIRHCDTWNIDHARGMVRVAMDDEDAAVGNDD